ncbi:unnamed protein product [Allacma fusca]|uniref:Uncharacterized protein n=1 Tax=Allacma fusca TaxID=39272 RepID=A0A8J2IZ43_9HEXA|nr:unnamed protein product [Allacma fusca]
MEDLKRQRTPVRKALLKAVENLETELDNEHKTRVTIQQFFSRAIFQRYQLNNLDRRVDQCLLEANLSDEELNEEYETATEYVNRFSDVEVRVRNYFDLCSYETECDVSISHRESSSKNQYRLPKLEFKKFNGEAKDWLGFWSQFKQIDQNVSMVPEEKFQYLIQATTEGSRAREVVQSFPPSAENYPKVIKYLKERFGKDEILLEVYVRELLRLVLKNAMNPNEYSVISNLYDKLETQFRALETLGVTSDKFAAMLYPLVKSCLPEEIIRAWERNRCRVAGQDGTSKDRLSQLMDFLKGEVDGELRISMARTGFGVENNESKKMKFKSKRKTIEEMPTATDLFSGQQVLDDWLGNGIIEEVPVDELENSSHYLPHRAVIKDSSETTKVRPVFDVSSKPKGGVSQNDSLEKGRNLLELIPKIIIGFRMNSVATLKKLFDDVPGYLKDTSQLLLKSLYVDTCVTSLSSPSVVQRFIRDATHVMSEAQFNLRGWIWNEPQESSEEVGLEKKVPVLGLIWDVKKDVLSLDLRDLSDDDFVAKYLEIESRLGPGTAGRTYSKLPSVEIPAFVVKGVENSEMVIPRDLRFKKLVSSYFY